MAVPGVRGYSSFSLEGCGVPVSSVVQRRKGVIDIAVAVACDPLNSVTFAVADEAAGAPLRWNTELLPMDSPVTTMCALPHAVEPTVAAGCENGFIHVLRRTDVAEQLPFQAHLNEPVLSLAVVGGALCGSTVDGEVFVIDVDTETRLQERTCVKLAGLGGLPVTELLPHPGSDNCALALVEHLVVAVDFRAAPDAAVVQRWRWEPLDTLRAVCTAGTQLIAGAHSGRAIVWDLRAGGKLAAGPDAAATSTAPIGGPFVAMGSLTPSSFVSATSNGLLHRWSYATATTGAAISTSSDAGQFTAVSMLAASASQPLGGASFSGLSTAEDVVVVPDSDGVVHIYSMASS